MALAATLDNTDPAMTLAPTSQHWMQGISGQVIDYAQLDPAAFNISDIALSLSRQPCFLGHTEGGLAYSVAAHSLWVSNYVALAMEDPLLALYALMQNAHEAYTGHLPAGLKSMPELSGYEDLQQRVQAAIYTGFGIPLPGDEIQAILAHANGQALATECVFLIAEGGAEWPVEPIDNTSRRLVNDIKAFIPASETCRAFINAFYLLMDRVTAKGER